MRAVLSVLVALTLLFGTAAVSRARLEGEGHSRFPAELLYLPKGPFLRALAVGHEETLADLLYIWSIQYYSNYDDKSRYGYLDQVFRGAITELDPRFTEAYLVGAMIMSLEAGSPDLALKLYDAGLERMPDNWELAYWAGWECYGARRYADARAYWARAAAMPGAPPQLIRLAARMLEKEGDLEAAVAEYRHILETTTDEATRSVVQKWLERTYTQWALSTLREAVAEFRSRTGRCPRSLDELVRARVVSSLPANLDGSPLYYDAKTCEVLPAPGQSFQRQP